MDETRATADAPHNREGKYCPRCRTMAARGQAVCAHCGHRFRTGTGDASQARPPATPAPDPLHRTMQFTLPPLPARTPPAPTPPPSSGLEPPAPAMLPRPGALAARPAVVGALALGALAVVMAGVFWMRRPAPPAAAGPVGAWAAAMPGGAGSLRLVFAPGGGGRWSAGDLPPAPLAWREDAAGRLVLSLPAPARPGGASAPLAGILSGRPWPWRVDPARRTLTLGTLTFTETR